MIKKMFVTDDGAQHSTELRAMRHDKRRSLNEFLVANLGPQSLWDGIAYVQAVKLSDVMSLVVDHSDKILQFAQDYRDAGSMPDYTFEDVENFVMLEMMKSYTSTPGVQPYSSHYVQTTVNKVWDVVHTGRTADGSYSDVQCELSAAACRKFLSKED